MRSRIARVTMRVSVVVAGLPALLLVGMASAGATPATQAVAPDDPFESIFTPVGMTAIVLGVIGMVAGVFRRKKIEVQPENQRKT